MRAITAEQRKNLNAWVEALRSRKFNQGHGSLVNNVIPIDIRYCCLGVAGRVIGLSDLELERQMPEDGCPVEEIGTFLGEKAAAKFGLTYADQQILAGMNDRGFSFDAIADNIVKTFGLLGSCSQGG